MHPGDRLLKWLPEIDFAVLGHGWAAHGRDYFVIVQDSLGHSPGTHEITFTHCVRTECETRVRDDVWGKSWGDEFTDYTDWEQAGAPAGYVWGVRWSNAYPGLSVVRDSPIADSWSSRLGKDMFEIAIETNQFLLRIVFHSIESRKLNDDTSTVSQVTIPLPSSEPEGEGGDVR